MTAAHSFKAFLERVGYRESKFPSSYDWLFELPENSAFLLWLCENVHLENVLSDKQAIWRSSVLPFVSQEPENVDSLMVELFDLQAQLASKEKQYARLSSQAEQIRDHNSLLRANISSRRVLLLQGERALEVEKENLRIHDENVFTSSDFSSGEKKSHRSSWSSANASRDWAPQQAIPTFSFPSCLNP